MFFAFLLTGVFFYLNQFFAARLLGTATYGEFGALSSLSFFLQFILFTFLTLLIGNSISKFKGQNNLQIIPIFHSRMLLYITLTGVAAFIIFSLLSGQIANFLHIDSVILIFFIGILFLFCWILPVNLGVMQGLQRFNHMALLNFLPAALKFFLSVTLMIIGFGLFGAVGGLVIGFIIAVIISFYLLRDLIRFPGLKKSSLSTSDPENASFSAREINREIKGVVRYSFPVIFAVICIAIPTNIDVVLIKHFFTSENAGLYTAVSVFGRAMLSVSVAITTVMYPKVVEAHTQKSETRNILNKSLLYTGLSAGAAAILLYILPNFFLGLFYGEEFLGAGSFLKIYGIFIFFFSLTTVLVYNSLAKNRYGFIYLFAALSFLEIGLIWLYHSSILNVIQIFLIISVITFVIGVCLNYSYPSVNTEA